LANEKFVVSKIPVAAIAQRRIAAPIVLSSATRTREITAPLSPPALKLASKNGRMSASASKAAEESTKIVSPNKRYKGALMRRARKRLHAAARIRKGIRYDARPIA